MDFMSCLTSTKHGNNCLFLVVDWFSRMGIFSPCNKSVIVESTAKIFFKNVWVHFGFPKTIVFDRYNRFLSIIWSNLWSMVDTKMTRSIAFHPQANV
jgi:hypothetical protein